MSPQPGNELPNYDVVLKDLFQRDQPVLRDSLTGGKRVVESLNVEFAVVERRADLVWLLEDGTILHLDFQSENEKKMPYRMGVYGLLIGEKYGRKVRQVVLYTGYRKMRMEDRLDLGQIKVGYRLMDIRELDAGALLRSGQPGDYALAFLASGGTAKLWEILQKARGLSKLKRERLLTQLVVLSGLRRMSGKVTMEMKRMGLTIDIKKNVFLREIRNTAIAEGIAKGIAKGRAEGKAEGKLALLAEQLATRFGPLPKWARTRLENPSPAQVDRWAKKVLTSDTLEGVLGKK